MLAFIWKVKALSQEKNGITELAGKFNGKGEPQVFIYDESRGYLIKKERSIA